MLLVLMALTRSVHKTDVLTDDDCSGDFHRFKASISEIISTENKVVIQIRLMV